MPKELSPSTLPHRSLAWTITKRGCGSILLFHRGKSTHDGMAGLPAIFGPSNVPMNPTPYLIFLRQNSPGDYVSLSLTSGSSFGLTSAQLADPNSPSSALVSISFIGHMFGGSTVTNTFTTPGNGATTLASYTFGSGFASGLTSVDILAPRWAMDNLVYVVPEPTSLSLDVVGALALLLSRRGIHARTRETHSSSRDQ